MWLTLMIAFLCVHFAPGWTDYNAFRFFEVVTLWFLFAFLIFFLMYVFRLQAKLPCINWTMTEFFHYILGTVLVFIASIVAAVKSHSISALLAGSIFGFIATFLLALSLFTSYKLVCGSQQTKVCLAMASPDAVYNTTTTSTPTAANKSNRWFIVPNPELNFTRFFVKVAEVPRLLFLLSSTSFRDVPAVPLAGASETPIFEIFFSDLCCYVKITHHNAKETEACPESHVEYTSTWSDMKLNDPLGSFLRRCVFLSVESQMVWKMIKVQMNWRSCEQ
ncbi:CKLF-like MARVEL transmembrane domain-containing protein 7 [Silurus asotus]|uniref:CKLF-like MARVEL transmembrane domain-containing protein 7 n=1 Tax=Silurus asotus TaxID=30991 RepID=A0AAD5A8U8_SILAS|nr:CKLF-like MARVEL transmembrane domain-containing protein 7 [Silurus asotus]